MTTQRWPGDIPPESHSLVERSQRLLEDVNDLARAHPHRTALEHGLLDALRSQALMIDLLTRKFIRIAGSDGVADEEDLNAPMT